MRENPGEKSATVCRKPRHASAAMTAWQTLVGMLLGARDQCQTAANMTRIPRWANPYSTNLTIGTSIRSTGWQNETKQSKNIELPNNSSSQHVQSLSDTYGSPLNAARQLKIIDLINISSNQHVQSAPYATASLNAVVQSEDLEPVDNPSRQQSQCPTGPSTPPVSHAPFSACTPNTDAIYLTAATDEQASLSSTASYCTAEETSGLRQPHLELQGQASPQCEGTGDCDRPKYFLQTLRR